ncbi:hypothetical protein BDN72DRAFT_247733 [Pluteus cervinus]|uniref:Uncharacterized protein n=1 Tax=Pluteus cervinus TaxID=181527 RepID=A0ACD3B5Q9_9AGAR|nr:hypothetical protein BDN72DRAFT_247733 [Pluteus cervinus]
MTKASSTKRAPSAPTQTRGKYAAQACSVCRSKKTRCDGRQPVCEPCMNSGRQDECTWDKEKIRKPRTEQHFEAMRKKMHAFKSYALQLEVLVENCKREHGQGLDIGSSGLLSRPQEMDFMEDSDSEDCEYEIDEEPASDIDDPVDEIFGSAPILKPEGPCLFEYGNTAVFRFAPEVLPVSRIPPVVEEPDQSYVLYVEGVDEAHINTTLDWSRYLPSSVPLTRREHDRLLDLLFKFLTCWCLRIIPALFLRDMWKVLSTPAHLPPPKIPHYSPMLHNALIALACGFSDDAEIRDNRGAFATKAKSYIDVEGRYPSITLMHALSILSTYHSSMGEQTLGYIYFGMSARISQTLGLGIDCSEWVKSGLISEHDRLDRNWAHWTTLCQDVCWSLYVGRDFSVQVPSDLRGIPVPFVDSDFDEIMWVYPPSGLQPQPNNLSKTFAASCQLLLMARQVMKVVNGIGASNNSRQEMVVSSIDLALNNWKRNLSPEVDLNHRTRPTATPHRLTMHMAYWWLFILLHRPWYHRQTRPLRGSDKEIDHIKLCKRAADNVMELLHTYRSLYSLRYCPISLVQIVFAAGTVFLLGAVHATSGLRVAKEALRHAQAQADLCIQYLMEIGRSWHCATNVAEIFRKLMYEKLWPWLERGASAIQDSGEEDEMHLEARPKGKARSLSRESSHPPTTRGRKPRKPRISKTKSSEAVNRPGPSMSPTETFSPTMDRRFGITTSGVASVAGATNLDSRSPRD